MTVFLCLYMIVCLGVTGALLEGSRLFACQSVLMMAKQTAAASILASYNRPLWEQYELLIWTGADGQGNPEALTEVYLDWLEQNLAPSRYGLDFYGMRPEEAVLCSYETVLSDSGRPFLEQILDAQESRSSSILLELANETAQMLPALSIPESGFRLDELLEDVTVHRILPRGTAVSDYHIPEGELPSEQLEGTVSETGIEKLLAAEYAAEHFSSFTDEDTGEMQYELEYILCGTDSDSLNLVSAARRLIKLRTAMNLALLIPDEEMHSIAEGIGAALAACLLMPEAESAVTLTVELLWSYFEAVEDVQDLYAGKCLPVAKKKADWHLWPHFPEIGDGDGKLSMNEVYEWIKTLFGKGTEEETEEVVLPDEEASGKELSVWECLRDGRWNYECYLYLLLCIEDNTRQLGRIMDVIQLEMQQEYPNFRLGSGCVGFELELTAYARPVFSGLSVQAGIWLNGQTLQDTVQVSFGDGLSGL